MHCTEGEAGCVLAEQLTAADCQQLQVFEWQGNCLLATYVIANMSLQYYKKGCKTDKETCENI